MKRIIYKKEKPIFEYVYTVMNELRTTFVNQDSISLKALSDKKKSSEEKDHMKENL